MISLSDINIRLIIKILSILLIIESFFIALSIPFSIYYGSNDLWPIIYSVIITGGVGGIFFLIFRKAKKTLGKREGYTIVSLSWFIVSIFGTLPFLLSGSVATFTDAFFEVMSGFTTTGASILTDIEAVPHGILFWRSMTHWLGGMGIIVLSLAILPFLGIGGVQLFAAEVPATTKDKLSPKISDTAKRLWAIYVLLTAAQTMLLLFGGMNFFDSLCHAFGTMATGGFSTQNASVANYSPYIQYVIIVFMFLAGVNFTLHYLALHGKIKEVYQNQELRFYALVVLIFTTIISIYVFLFSGAALEKSIRDSLFQVVSIITTTGFVSANYLLWPAFAWFLIFILMFTGGSAGSTGGGIKMIRHLILFKSAAVELKRLIHPRAVINVKYNSHVIGNQMISVILAFLLFYILIFVLGSIIMSAIGLDFQTAVGATIASLGNIGPGLGKVGPVDNFSWIPNIGKWVLSFLMLLGRLELFTILVFLSPGFWKK